ncbi:MAG TPA: DUF3810 domain-containing protein [Candidatus Faecousia intestinigallinarum]|nr:DUF3810 domain-containing protein [Candidatus Faecousia intestinigallinarum]
MKYWRGYLTAGIFGLFTWLLMEFAKTHAQIVDMVYPYISRMLQTTLAEWSGGVDFCLWQLLAVLLLLGVIASIVLMVVLRWNPIQWFGWILAVAAGIFFLHTGLYGLNTYAGPIADDLRLEVVEYTLDELQEATVYYRDKANALAGQVSRDAGGNPQFADFDALALQAANGFDAMTYDEYEPVFAGSRLPVKKLAWADLYTSMGITGVTMGITGEAAVNPQIPAVSLPFTICHEMSHRNAIAIERDANFAAFLACRANESVEFQYSGYFMAYRYCYNALVSAGGSLQAQEVAGGESSLLKQDLAAYRDFFAGRQDQTATNLANKANDTYLKISGDEQGVASYQDVSTLLVSLYHKEVVLPAQVIPEPEFDPLDSSQVDVTDIPRVW